MMTPEERYRRDPMFAALVNMMKQYIEKMELTPTEMREAAILACYQYEMDVGRRTTFFNALDRIAEAEARSRENTKQCSVCFRPGPGVHGKSGQWICYECLEKTRRLEYGPREHSTHGVHPKDVQDPKMLGITSSTATCSQIGASLGLTFSKISALAIRHQIPFAGTVSYEVGPGRKTKPARTFDLRGWEAIRDAAIKEGLIQEKDYDPPNVLLRR